MAIKVSDKYIESEMKKAIERIEFLQMMKRAWVKEYSDDNLVDFVFYTYLHTCNVTITADIVNEKGFRKKGDKGRDIKYVSNDMSKILRDEMPSDEELGHVCKYVFNKNVNSNGYLR